MINCVFNLEDIFPYIYIYIYLHKKQIPLKGIWCLRLVPLMIKSWWKRRMRLSLDVVRGQKKKKKFNFWSCFELVIFYNFESLICIKREIDTCYVRCARRLLVLLLHAKIILSWETDVHESQSTTKIIVWGAQSVLRT